MKYIVSLMEIAVTGIVIFLIIFENNIWMRGEYVCMFCLLVFIYSWDMGILSDSLGIPIFKIIGSIEFEFFILHQVVIRIIDNWVITSSLGWVNRSLIAFMLLLICCYVWKRYFKSLAQKGMNSIFDKLQSVY